MKDLSIDDKKVVLEALDVLAFKHYARAEACRRCTQPDGDTDSDEAEACRAEKAVVELKNRLTTQWTRKKTVVTKTTERVFR